MVLILYFFGLIFSSFFMFWFECFFFLMIGVLYCLYLNFSSLSVWGLNFELGFDLLGWSLVCLSVWMGGLMMLSSVKSAYEGLSGTLFLSLVCLLTFFLICSFSTQNLIYFYIFFESSIIPIFLLILGWGYQPERLQAGIYMLFYTLFGSLPLLLCLVGSFSFFGTYWISGFLCVNIDSVIWGVGGFLGFLIKLPMFFTHLWLPSAHVEAPVSGSMVLAGVLLKLGGYGMLRLGVLFNKFISKVSGFLMSVGVLGVIYIGMICLRQSDVKSLIAYSSVAHMGLVLGGFLVLSSWGWEGCLVLMLGHGLCSSGLFCLANCTYERLGSRSLFINKGLMVYYSGMGLWWFLLSVCNMASPPSLNLLGEIILYISIVMWSKSLMIFLFLGSFLSGAYSIYLYSLSQHGACTLGGGLSGSKCSEYTLMMLHWVPLNLLILKSEAISCWL